MLLDGRPLPAGDGSWLTAKAMLAAVRACPKLRSLKLWSCPAATNAVMAAALQLELLGELAITGKHAELASGLTASVPTSAPHLSTTCRPQLVILLRAVLIAGAAQQQRQHALCCSAHLHWHCHGIPLPTAIAATKMTACLCLTPAGHDRSQGKLTTACLKPLLDGKAVHLRKLYLTDQSIGFEQVLKLIKKRGKVLEVSCPAITSPLCLCPPCDGTQPLDADSATLLWQIEAGETDKHCPGSCVYGNMGNPGGEVDFGYEWYSGAW